MMKRIGALALALFVLSCSAALGAQEYRHDPETDTLYRTVGGREIELADAIWQMKGNEQEPFLAYVIMDPQEIPGIAEESGIAIFNLAQDGRYVGLIPLTPREMEDMNVVSAAEYGDYAAIETPSDSTIRVYDIGGPLKKLQQVPGRTPMWIGEGRMIYTSLRENPPLGGRLFRQISIMDAVTGESSLFKACTDREEFALERLYGHAALMTRYYVPTPEEWGDLRAVKSEKLCEWLPSATPEDKLGEQYIIEDEKLRRIKKGRLVDIDDAALQFTKNADPDADALIWFPVGPDAGEELADEKPGIYFYHPLFGFLAFHPLEAAAFCSEVAVAEDLYMFDCGTSVVRDFQIFKFVPGEQNGGNRFERVVTLTGLDSAFWIDSQRVAYTLLDYSQKRPPVSELDCGFSAAVYEIPLKETSMLKKCSSRSSFTVMGVKDGKIEVEETYVKQTKDWKYPEKYQRRITRINVPAAG